MLTICRWHPPREIRGAATCLAGTPFTAGCTAGPLQLGEVYTEQQVQTAYGVNALRSTAAGTPVITVLDLGGGWQAIADLGHDRLTRCQ